MKSPSASTPNHAAFILENVAALTAEGITVIYTSHYLQEIETLCSQIALLNHGRLVYHGALGDILQQGGRHILRFQTVPPCSPAQAAAWGGSLDAQGAVQLATDEAGAAHIWQMVRQQGFQTAFSNSATARWKLFISIFSTGRWRHDVFTRSV